MAADCSFFLWSTALRTVFAPYFSPDGSGLLILSHINGFHDGLRAVLPRGLQHIAHTSVRNGFHNGLRAALLSRWQRIAHTSARQRLSRRIKRRIAPAADCSSSGLLIIPLVNGFHDGLRAIFHSGWQQIAHSFSPQRLSQRFAHRIAHQMVAHCSFFRLSTAFTMIFAPYCSADNSGLLILPLINGFHEGFRAVLLLTWQRIAHFSARRLSRWFARRISQWMAADCTIFLSSTAFMTVFALYCSAGGSECSFLCSSTFMMVCAPYCLSDRSLEGLYIRLYAALPTVCMPYALTEAE